MISANYNDLKWGLEEFSSKDEQLRLWCNIANEKREISSLDEACCSVFNYDVTRLLDGQKADFDLPDKIITLLRALHKKIRLIPSGLSPVEQVEHPEMDEVRRIASELLSKIDWDESLLHKE